MSLRNSDRIIGRPESLSGCADITRNPAIPVLVRQLVKGEIACRTASPQHADDGRCIAGTEADVIQRVPMGPIAPTSQVSPCPPTSALHLRLTSGRITFHKPVRDSR
jgi:hypothetical protein